MISLNDIKYFLNINTNADDEFLMKLIDMTTAKINNYCGRKVSYSRIYEILDGKNQNVIFLKNYPVEKVESIFFRKGSGAFDYDLFSGSTIEENLYCEQESGKVLLLNGYELPQGNSNIRIKYFAGYIEDAEDPVNELPLDLKWVAMMMTAEAYLKSFRANIDEKFTKRIGLDKLDIVEKKDGLETRYSLTFKEEDYSNIISKYLSRKL